MWEGGRGEEGWGGGVGGCCWGLGGCCWGTCIKTSTGTAEAETHRTQPETVTQRERDNSRINKDTGIKGETIRQAERDGKEIERQADRQRETEKK